MKKPEHQPLDADMQRELAAIDAALAGDEISAGREPLARLAVALREMRERPSEDFADALDARAARGFPRARPRAPRLRRPNDDAPGRARRVRPSLLRPASGVAFALILAIAVAVPLLRSAATHHAPQHAAFGADGSPPSTVAAGALAGAGAGAAQKSGSPTATESASPARAPLATSAEGASGAAIAPRAPAAEGGAAERLIERTAALDVGVEPAAVQARARSVFTLVSAVGGYVRQSSVSSSAARGGEEPPVGDERERGGASFDIRVPSSNLSIAIARLAQLGHVRSENDTTNDVTDRHTALHDAFEEAQAERAALLAKLRGASAEGEVTALKGRLRGVDAHISSLERQLRALDQRVTYTSLALSLTPETPAGASSGDLTPGGAAHDAARILDAGLAVLVLAAAALLPLGAAVVAGWMLVALTRRRLREHTLDAS